MNLLFFLILSVYLFFLGYRLIEENFIKFFYYLFFIAYVWPFSCNYFGIFPAILKLLYVPIIYGAFLKILLLRTETNRNKFSKPAVYAILFFIVAFVSTTINFANPLLAILSTGRVSIPFILLFITGSLNISENAWGKLINALLLIGLIQVPLQFFEYFYLSTSDLIASVSRADSATGTFGLGQTGSLAIYYTLLILLIFTTKKYNLFYGKNILILPLLLMVILMGFILTFSGGAVIILGIVMLIFFLSKSKKSLVLIPFLIFLLSAFSTYFSELVPNGLQKPNLIEYSTSALSSEIENLLYDPNFYYHYHGNGSRVFGILGGWHLASNSNGGLLLGAGPGQMLQAKALGSFISVKTFDQYYNIFSNNTIINTIGFLLGEYGILGIILFFMVFLSILTQNLKFKKESKVMWYIMLIILFLYSFYYNIIYDYQFLIIYITTIFYFKSKFKHVYRLDQYGENDRSG